MNGGSMKRSPVVYLAYAAALALAATTNAAAQTHGKTADGLAYVSGGATVAELRALSHEKPRYDLWVTTAADGSGAFLSDATLKVVDAKRNVVLETSMTGPWLFVDLPPGAYTIEATFDGQVQKRVARIAPGDQQQVILYFKSPAEVSPDWVSPFDVSPYATK